MYDARIVSCKNMTITDVPGDAFKRVVKMIRSPIYSYAYVDTVSLLYVSLLREIFTT